MNSPKNYYDILGVSSSASPDEIKRAYRKLAQKFHPDVNKDAGAEAMMKSVNEAYETLGNPDKRAHYDRFGSSQGPTSNPQGSYGPYGGQQAGYNPFEDIFAEILRQQQNQQRYQQQDPNYQRPRMVRFNFFTFIIYLFAFQFILRIFGFLLSFLFGF